VRANCGNVSWTRQESVAQHGMHLTRAPRSINWLVLVSKVWVSDRILPDLRERVMLTLGGNLSIQNRQQPKI
jgi:hypothetical protein